MSTCDLHGIDLVLGEEPERGLPILVCPTCRAAKAETRGFWKRVDEDAGHPWHDSAKTALD